MKPKQTVVLVLICATALVFPNAMSQTPEEELETEREAIEKRLEDERAAEQKARMSMTPEELLDAELQLIKEFAEAAAGAGTYGLSVSLDIPYRSFLDDDTRISYDLLRLYVPNDEIKRFAEYEITSQGLVDASIIIVNDNRVAVTLG